jgi:hypothetical protein
MVGMVRYALALAMAMEIVWYDMEMLWYALEMVCYGMVFIGNGNGNGMHFLSISLYGMH